MKSEQQLLRVSLVANMVIAVAALATAAAARSMAILFDGMYALIACLMTMVSSKVVEVLSRPDDNDYPFGYQNWEPLLNAVKGLVILAVGVNTFFSSFKSFLAGGRLPIFSFAAAYALFAMVLSLIMAFLSKNRGRKIGSPILQVEARNWMIGGLLSGVVAAAFTIGFFGEGEFVLYLDPLLTMAMVALVIPVPIKIIYTAFRQLLFVAPDKALVEVMRERYRAFPKDDRIVQSALRVTKVGRVIYVHITAVLFKDTCLKVGELDIIRRDIAAAVVKDDPHTFCDVLFTSRSTEPVSLSI